VNDKIPTDFKAANDHIFDEDGFLRRLMGDREIAKLILDNFVENFPQQIESLKESISKSDIAKVKRLSHSIKGSSGNLGAMRLQAAAAEIESACAGEDLNTAAMQLPKLSEQFQQFREVATHFEVETKDHS